MGAIDMNPRFANYARAQGRTPEQQLELDRQAMPGACMFPFVHWNTARLRQASQEIPEAFIGRRLWKHEAYDEWLTEWVDRHLAEKDADACL